VTTEAATGRPTIKRRGLRVPGVRSRRIREGATYKVMFVCSSGGHLAQVMKLRPWWEDRDRVWVTFDKPDALSQLDGERMISGHHPTTRNIPNLLRNLVLAVRVLREERPDVIFSNGAGLGVPFMWLGHLMGARTVFFEVYDRISTPTMTARLVRPVCDLFLVQWPEQLSFDRNAVLAGPVY
jgi:UDP-N-acetylglucosamine:LPS N-acetylglucosamine transferase